MSRLYPRSRKVSRHWGVSYKSTMGEINLRSELNNILNGSPGKPARGHWVIYRRFDLTSPSKYYDEVYSTGVGGPSYNYTDILIKVRRDPIVAPESAEAETPMGLLPGGRYVYYLEHNTNPSNDDQIFEIRWSDHTKTPKLINIPHPYEEKHNIKEVVPRRLDSGRIEYWTVYTNIDKVSP